MKSTSKKHHHSELEKALQEVKEHRYAGEYASLEEFRKDLYSTETKK